MTKKLFLASVVSFGLTFTANALVINEVMSNPVGDDGGREWVELYNETAEPVDISSLTISVKGGIPLVITPLSGGTSIAAYGYAIISSTVGGISKFTQDYGSYEGPFFKSSISLVNTGVTSLEIFLNGVSLASLTSYTAAKEGSTYSLLSGSFGAGSPTPGKENQAVTSSQVDQASTTPTDTQVTIAKMVSPSSDITLFLPSERTIVAGAPAAFWVHALSGSGRGIDNMSYTWAFGDGGQRVGSSTHYRYFYPGRYIAQVEGTNGLMSATGRILVHVVAPDIALSRIESGKYGPYITLTNPNTYDLDISDWKLSIDGAIFPFPKNTMLGMGETRFSSLAMGFASTTVSSSTLLKILFPSMDEVLRIMQGGGMLQEVKKEKQLVTKKESRPTLNRPVHSYQKKVAVFTKSTTSPSITPRKIATGKEQKDTRIASFVKTLFSK